MEFDFTQLHQSLNLSRMGRRFSLPVTIQWRPRYNTRTFDYSCPARLGAPYGRQCISEYLLSYLLPYLLTPRIRVLLEKLTRSQLVKKFPAFYGIQRFITAFTSARHLSIS